jgi:hypothetical protein
MSDEVIPPALIFLSDWCRSPCCGAAGMQSDVGRAGRPRRAGGFVGQPPCNFAQHSEHDEEQVFRITVAP